MSKESRQSIERMKKLYQNVEKDSQELSKEAGKLGDKDLSKKIEKVQEGSREVVKHIEEKMG